MNYTAQTKVSGEITVEFNGAPPIDGGALTFNAESRITLPSITYRGCIRAQRIKFDDLTSTAGTYYYDLKYISGNIANDPGSVNLVGEPIDLPVSLNIAYITSNVACEITGSIPFPPVLEANKMVLIATNIVMSPAPVNAGDYIMSLTWSNTDIDALGHDNFYCDLILG